VDDLDAWGPERSEGWFEVMRAVQAVGRGVIAFLAQIEDFQKRLFMKKKLVVSAEYCLTLDRVPEEPFRYKLKLRDGEETREMPVDLPETFAYLLGLRVRGRRVYFDGERRYLVYLGSTPERGEVAAIWRDTEGWDTKDFERDRDFVLENGLAGDADEVFVNGDSFIPEARPLESVFKRLMLAEPAVG